MFFVKRDKNQIEKQIRFTGEIKRCDNMRQVKMIAVFLLLFFITVFLWAAAKPLMYFTSSFVTIVSSFGIYKLLSPNNYKDVNVIIPIDSVQRVIYTFERTFFKAIYVWIAGSVGCILVDLIIGKINIFHILFPTFNLGIYLLIFFLLYMRECIIVYKRRR